MGSRTFAHFSPIRYQAPALQDGVLFWHRNHLPSNVLDLRDLLTLKRFESVDAEQLPRKPFQANEHVKQDAIETLAVRDVPHRMVGLGSGLIMGMHSITRLCDRAQVE